MSGLAGLTGLEVAAMTDGGMSPRRITVGVVEAAPPEYPIEFTVEMKREEATIDDPAQVTVTVTNRGDRDITLGVGYPGVFSGVKSVESTPGLLLVPIDKNPNDLPKRRSQCPQPIRGWPLPAYLQHMPLDLDERKSKTFEVWGKHENDTEVCIPDGTFTFETEYTVLSSNDTTFDWGFTLNVYTGSQE